MAIFSRHRKGPVDGDVKQQQNGSSVDKHADEAPVRIFSFRVIAMALIVSIGGLIFGYDTGQISGFLEMGDFISRFSEDGTSFSDVRSGTIVGLLSIGTLCGALFGSPIADAFGRRIAIIVWNLVFIVGVIVQITTTSHWYQIAIGRLVAGFGVGGLSVLTPMYQSETAPRQVRGALVSCYQLFITLGIFLANCVNLGTNDKGGAYEWQVPMGVGFVWPVLMIAGILTLPESPRWDYRKGRIERARKTIAGSYSVSENHWEVERELKEIKAKFEAENAGGDKHPFYEVFTGPRMLYRVLLGVALQALQQLTGANYYFYYGTTIFTSVGLSNAYVTALILSVVNFVMTFPGLWVVEHFGRRRALITGSLWQFMCFMIFASVGHFSLDHTDGSRTPQAGAAMIVFACLFIAGYAMTWGPIIWAVIGEIFPTRYRALAMGICTASNWIWNFLISFFTPFITNSIDYQYGYVFAATNFLGALTVYFFLCESSGRTLEEIDTMYIMHVPPRQSTKWEPPKDEELVTADSLYLKPGARDIQKTNSSNQADKLEDVPPPTSSHGIHDVSGTGYAPEATGARGNSIV